MTEPHVTLFAADLLSKWGFNDGDEPDAWLDWCDNQGIDWTKLEYPTVALVRQHLLPVLEQNVTVVDIETCHNPIRAETVDGVDVHQVWYAGRDVGPQLTPEYVDVPMTEVLRLALAEAGLTDPPRYMPPLGV